MYLIIRQSWPHWLYSNQQIIEIFIFVNFKSQVTELRKITSIFIKHSPLQWMHAHLTKDSCRWYLYPIKWHWKWLANENYIFVTTQKIKFYLRYLIIMINKSYFCYNAHFTSLLPVNFGEIWWISASGLTFLIKSIILGLCTAISPDRYKTGTRAPQKNNKMSHSWTISHIPKLLPNLIIIMFERIQIDILCLYHKKHYT